MKGKFLIAICLGIAASIFSVPLLAHHGAANYDMDKRVTVKGTVTDWLWSNPHCVVQIDATDDSGQVVHWVTETENPSSMIRSGWTKDSIKVGDHITIILVPIKGGRPVGRIAEIVLPDGHKLVGRGVPIPDAKPGDPAKP